MPKPRRDSASEVREGELQSPVHGGSEPGSEPRGSLEGRGLADEGSPTLEEPKVMDEASPQQTSSGCEVPSDVSPVREERTANPEIDSDRWRRSRVSITPWGERYHPSSECPTLNQTRRIRFSPWCQACAVTSDHRGLIYAVGPGKVAHVRGNCPRIERIASRLDHRVTMS